jgi:hypothetical protein
VEDAVSEAVRLLVAVRDVVGDAVAELVGDGVDEADAPLDGVCVLVGDGDGDAATTPLMRKGDVYDCPGAAALVHSAPPLAVVATAEKGSAP